MSESRTKRRIERVKKDIDIAQVLFDLGYPVRSDAGDREEQFSCDLHGDGRDTKPSARTYPSSNAWFCFACDKSRDAIETIREKKGLGFMEALDWLERKYNLPALPWEPEERERSLSDDVYAQLNQSGSFENDRLSLESFLDSLTKDRMLPMSSMLSFWEAFDKLLWLVTEQQISEIKARATLLGLRDRVLEALKKLSKNA